MRWTCLDYALLVVALAAFLLASEQTTNAANCQTGKCAPILYYTQSSDGTFWHLDQLDCDKCSGANGSCQWGPWNPNCFPVDVPLNKRKILTGGIIVCFAPVPPGGGQAYAEAAAAWNATYAEWNYVGPQWTCQPP
jgi:hypothetical protein